MTFVRKNVWTLGDDWADDLLWYARGVAAMKAKPLAEPTSWRFYAAMHGFHAGLWQQLGYLFPTDQPPSNALVQRFWRQCQHGSWYFLPWHRGYVLSLEANVRAAVAASSGPEDWALPYWNYFEAGQEALPPAFASRSWPDGANDNPLFVEPRYGPNGDGDVFVPGSEINLNAMGDPDFTGVGNGGGTGFGGIDTGFSHGGPIHGGLERQPHDQVHGLVGGLHNQDETQPGAMSVPASAGLDPIFWLHHANIDRLWEIWNRNPPTDVDPTDPKWLGGPASIGERAFVAPMPDGTAWTYTPDDVADIGQLGYTYDDLSPVAPAVVLGGPRTPAPGVGPEGVQAMPEPSNVEMIGANTEPVRVHGTDVRSAVVLDRDMGARVAESLRSHDAAAEGAGPPASADRVFLNLENVRARSDALSLAVYVGLPDDAEPAEHPELLADTVGLFGVSQASDPDEEHAGQGLTYVIEISKIVDHLDELGSFDVDALPVRIVPRVPVPEGAEVSIGRISIYRQGR